MRPRANTPSAGFLVLRLAADLSLYEWAVANASGAILRGPWKAENADFQAACQLPALIMCNSPELLVRQVQVPARAQERFRSAVGFALEDSLAGEVDELQFALPEPLAEGMNECVLARASWLAALKQRLQAWGIAQSQLVPECLLLPPNSALLERHFASFKLGANSAGAIESDSLVSIFRQRNQLDGALPITLYHTDALELKGLPSYVSAEPLGYVLHFLLQQALAHESWGNLLKSEAPANQAPKVGGVSWRWALVLAGGAALLQLLSFFSGYWQLLQKDAAQRAEISAMFAEVFPGKVAYEGNAIDPTGMLQSKLKQDSQRSSALQNGGLLALLSLAAPILVGETRVTLVNAEYRNGELELGMRAANLITLDGVRGRLATLPELNVALGNNVVDPSGQMLTGRIKLSLRTSASSNSSTPRGAP